MIGGCRGLARFWLSFEGLGMLRADRDGYMLVLPVAVVLDFVVSVEVCF